MDKVLYKGSVYTADVEAMLNTIPLDRPVRTDWTRDGLTLRVNPAVGEVISVRLNALPGWQASSGILRRNGLGLLTIDPAQAGPQVIELRYGKPLEHQVLSGLTIATALFFAVWMGLAIRRKRVG